MTIIPPQDPFNPEPSYFDQPDLACGMCRGLGHVMLEDADGRPTVEVVCPYCKGRQTASWVSEKRNRRVERKRVHRRLLWIVTPLVIVAFNVIGAPGSAWWALVWVPMILAWVLAPGWLSTPLPIPHRKHAPGFTDHREVMSLGIFAVGVGAKTAWDQHRKGSREDA